jgi:uncharacterized protein (DUF1330 family)
MTAYVIVDIDVHDLVGYDEYKKLAPAIVESFGGKYLARGGRTEILEGDWSPNRLVILQLESVRQAKKWVDSPEYSEARKMRLSTTNSKMVVIEGV